MFSSTLLYLIVPIMCALAYAQVINTTSCKYGYFYANNQCH